VKWTYLKNPLLLLIALTLGLGVLAAGCGGSSSSSSTTTETESAAAGEEEAGGEEAEASEETAASEEPGEPEYTILSEEEVLAGTGGSPPKSSPAAAEGANIWWVSCGMQIPDCSVPAKSAEAAAKKLGVEFHIADGKLNENGGDLTAIKTALAANPTALIIHGISCNLIAPALQEAKAREIPVMGVEALDCNEGLEEGEEGTELFTAEMKYNENAESGLEYFQSWGNIAASYMIDKLGENIKLINSEANEAGLQKTVTNAFNATFEQCKGCEVLDGIKFVSSDLAPGGAYAQALRASLVKDGTATALYAPFDVNITAAEGAAEVEKQGLTGKLFTCCGSGGAPVLDLVRAGKWSAAETHSAEWMGWGAIDDINRVLNEEETVPEGIGFVIATKEKNLPPNPEEEFNPPGTPWQKEYEKAWSAAG
jgi:ribose transport system substrate-binding protein